jgi:hybrid cluster-associated redox disulfide protein
LIYINDDFPSAWYNVVMTPGTPADKPQFSANTLIADALAHGPEVAAVFIRYRMHCIGCVFARFESLRIAAINHQVDIEELAAGLNEAVRER